MTRAFPTVALVAIIALACDDPPPGPTADDLKAQDSALTHEVMAAWGDSFHVTVEEPRFADSATTTAQAKTSPGAASSAQPAAAGTPVTPQRVLPSPLIASAPSTLAVTRSEPKRQQQPARPRARSIPPGSSLSLVTTERVCSSRVGETFRATLVSPVSTGSGTIPRGARATAEITSNDQWGAGIGVIIRSIHYDGATYSVSSRVTYIVAENSDDGTCIPRRAHIDTEARG